MPHSTVSDISESGIVRRRRKLPAPPPPKKNVQRQTLQPEMKAELLHVAQHIKGREKREVPQTIEPKVDKHEIFRSEIEKKASHLIEKRKSNIDFETKEKELNNRFGRVLPKTPVRGEENRKARTGEFNLLYNEVKRDEEYTEPRNSDSNLIHNGHNSSNSAKVYNGINGSNYSHNNGNLGDKINMIDISRASAAAASSSKPLSPRYSVEGPRQSRHRQSHSEHARDTNDWDPSQDLDDFEHDIDDRHYKPRNTKKEPVIFYQPGVQFQSDAQSFGKHKQYRKRPDGASEGQRQSKKVHSSLRAFKNSVRSAFASISKSTVGNKERQTVQNLFPQDGNDGDRRVTFDNGPPHTRQVVHYPSEMETYKQMRSNKPTWHNQAMDYQSSRLRISTLVPDESGRPRLSRSREQLFYDPEEYEIVTPRGSYTVRGSELDERQIPVQVQSGKASLRMKLKKRFEKTKLKATRSRSQEDVFDYNDSYNDQRESDESISYSNNWETLKNDVQYDTRPAQSPRRRMLPKLPQKIYRRPKSDIQLEYAPPEEEVVEVRYIHKRVEPDRFYYESNLEDIRGPKPRRLVRTRYSVSPAEIDPEAMIRPPQHISYAASKRLGHPVEIVDAPPRYEEVPSKSPRNGIAVSPPVYKTDEDSDDDDDESDDESEYEMREYPPKYLEAIHQQPYSKIQQGWIEHDLVAL